MLLNYTTTQHHSATPFFVRSGDINLSTRYLRDVGRTGNYWSRSSYTYTSFTSATAYYLGFTNAIVYPSNSPWERWLGYPVRCLVYKFSFVRSGNIRLDLERTLKGPGSDGNGWASSATSYKSAMSAHANYVAFSALETWSTLTYLRSCGFPVRCLVY